MKVKHFSIYLHNILYITARENGFPLVCYYHLNAVTLNTSFEKLDMNAAVLDGDRTR